MRIMHEKHSKKLNICLATSRGTKAGRDRFSGVMRYAASHRNWVVRFLTPSSLRLGLSTASDIKPGEQIDGLICASKKFWFDDIHAILPPRRRIPTVSLDDPDPESSKASFCNAAITIDDYNVGNEAASYFLRRGLRNLAFADNDNMDIVDDSHQTRRFEAFRRTALKAGATFDEFKPLRENADDDVSALAKWLSQLPLPCGVMAYNDSRAQCVIDACHLARLNIPEQIQVIGVDNDEMICENTSPTLTSIQPDFESGGYLAAQLLDEMLDKGMPKKTMTRTYGIKTLVERASTQDLKGGGRLVTLGMEFMRLNFARRIDVADVAAALNISRRTLEKRFTEVRGEGVADALRRTRLDCVRNLLRETEKPVDEIAYECGFISAKHLMTLFKRTHGMTMGEWRREKRGQGSISNKLSGDAAAKQS